MATITINPKPATITSGMSDPRADKLWEILHFMTPSGDDMALDGTLIPHEHDQDCLPALLAEWDHVRDLIKELLEDF